MTRLNTSPKDSTSLRRTVGEVGGLLIIWSWIGWKVSRGVISSVVDRGFALALSRVVGSEPYDPDALDWALRSVADEGVVMP